MSRIPLPAVVTANHLLDGDVIYLATSGEWVRAHGDAALYTDAPSAEAALAIAAADPATAVGPYLAAARSGPDGPEPVHFREGFRARGPSNRPHGKQAEAI